MHERQSREALRSVTAGTIPTKARPLPCTDHLVNPGQVVTTPHLRAIQLSRFMRSPSPQARGVCAGQTPFAPKLKPCPLGSEELINLRWREASNY